MSIGLFTVADLNDVPDPVAFETWAGLTTDGQLYVYNGAGWTQITGGAGTVSSVGLAGTANQIAVAGATPITGAGSWTLSIPTNPVLPGTASGTFSGNLTGNVTGTASGNLTSATGVASVSKNGSAQLHGDVTLSQGSNVTLTQTGQDISIAATGGEAGVSSITGPGSPATPLTGAVTFSEGSNITLTQVGQDIEIAASGAAAGVDSIAVGGSPSIPLTGDVTLSEGANVTLTQVGQDIEIAASGGGGGLTLVEHKQFTAGATSYSLAGLDGDTDGVYLLQGKLVGAGGGTPFYSIRLNAQATTYSINRIQITNATVITAFTEPYVGGADSATVIAFTAKIFARKSVNSVAQRRMYFAESISTLGGVITWNHWQGWWTDTSNNITSILLFCDTANGIGDGSEIWLYKYEQ